MSCCLSHILNVYCFATSYANSAETLRVSAVLVAVFLGTANLGCDFSNDIGINGLT